MEFLKKKLNSKGKKIISSLQELFNYEQITKKGEELGFVRRKSKIGSYNFMLSNLLALDANGGSCSLTDINNELSRNFGVLSKDQSINERFTHRSVALSKWMLEETMRKKIVEYIEVKCLNKFSSIEIQDATGISLPEGLADHFKGYGGDGSQSGLKLDLRMDLLSTDFNFRIKQATDNDQNGLTFGVEKSSLWIRDLGYFKYKEFRNIAKQGGYFLSRLQNGANIYIDKKYRSNSKIDLLGLVEQMADNQTIDRWAYLGYEKRWPVRVVINKLPKEEVEKRKKRIIKYKKNKGKKYTNNLLKLLELNIFITNIPEQMCNAEEILELYTIRWQIEILFKAWKTNYEIDDVKLNIKGDRALTQFYLHMILVVITTNIFRMLKLENWKENKTELSEIKGIKVIKKWVGGFLKGLSHEVKPRIDLFTIQLNQMFLQVLNSSIKSSGKKNINKLFFPDKIKFDIC